MIWYRKADCIRKYVEPDVSVICDPNKLDDKGCNGTLDWIVDPAQNKVLVYSFGVPEETWGKSRIEKLLTMIRTRFSRMVVYAVTQGTCGRFTRLKI